MPDADSGCQIQGSLQSVICHLSSASVICDLSSGIWHLASRSHLNFPFPSLSPVVSRAMAGLRWRVVAGSVPARSGPTREKPAHAPPSVPHGSRPRCDRGRMLEEPTRAQAGDNPAEGPEKAASAPETIDLRSGKFDEAIAKAEEILKARPDDRRASSPSWRRPRPRRRA